MIACSQAGLVSNTREDAAVVLADCLLVSSVVELTWLFLTGMVVLENDTLALGMDHT